MKTLNIKPNYSELSRIYKIDRRTIKSYNNGYSKENRKIIRTSKLDNLKEETKIKALTHNEKIIPLNDGEFIEVECEFL